MEPLIFFIAIGVIIFALKSFSGTNPKQRTHRPRSQTHRKPALSPKRHPQQRPLKQHTKGIEHDPPPPIPPERRLVGKAWVIDGDTIVINRIKIRLAGIDAPELDQPWGQKSKWKMVSLCKGQTIRCELTGETSYDRLVGTCFLPDGRDIGAEIVEAGLALDGGYFSKGKYAHLEDSEMRAKLSRYGHWRKKKH